MRGIAETDRRAEVVDIIPRQALEDIVVAIVNKRVGASATGGVFEVIRPFDRYSAAGVCRTSIRQVDKHAVVGSQGVEIEPIDAAG